MLLKPQAKRRKTKSGVKEPYGCGATGTLLSRAKMLSSLMLSSCQTQSEVKSEVVPPDNIVIPGSTSSHPPLPLRYDYDCDVAIVGAGVAGSAAAHAFAKTGRRVVVIERDMSEPNRIVGELMQPGGVHQLEQLDLEHAMEGIDAPVIHGYAIVRQGEWLKLRYPRIQIEKWRKERMWGKKKPEGDIEEGRRSPAPSNSFQLNSPAIGRSRPNHHQAMEQWSTQGILDDLKDVASSSYSAGSSSESDDDNTYQIEGRSFHHGRFIMSLRSIISNNPAIEIREAVATDLVEDNGRVTGLTYKDREGNLQNVYAPLTVVCDGLHSRFRKELVDQKTVAKSCFVGVVVKDVDLPYPNYGHVILGKPAPILSYPISSRDVRILVDIPKPIPSASNGDLKKFLLEVTAPQIPNGYRQAFIDEVAADRVRSMPCGRLHPQPYKKKGVVLLGDAWNVRHPLTGGGMSVALHDVVVLRDLLANEDLKELAKIDAIIEMEFYGKRKGRAAVINILAQALYEVFAAHSDPMLVHMQEATFAYFRLSDFCVSGTMSLLACTTVHPSSLIFHFFAVGIFAMMKAVYPIPWPHRLYRAFRIGVIAGNLLLPLLSGEHILPI